MKLFSKRKSFEKLQNSVNGWCFWISNRTEAYVSDNSINTCKWVTNQLQVLTYTKVLKATDSFLTFTSTPFQSFQVLWMRWESNSQSEWSFPWFYGTPGSIRLPLPQQCAAIAIAAHCWLSGWGKAPAQLSCLQKKKQICWKHFEELKHKEGNSVGTKRREMFTLIQGCAENFG